MVLKTKCTTKINFIRTNSIEYDDVTMGDDCYATILQNRRRDRSMNSKLASSRGKPPLRYTNEQLLDDTNEKIVGLCYILSTTNRRS